MLVMSIASPPRVSQSSARRRVIELREMDEEPIADLLRAAASGSRPAWDAIVERYGRLVWSVVRGFRLDDAAAADVTQTVWLRLVEHCDRIRDPERLPGWLAATARNEAMRVSNKQRRQIPSDFEFDIADDNNPSAFERLVDFELKSAMIQAFRQLPEEGQQLLRLLCTDPPLDYQTIAELIGRPVGSIGPTRARLLDKLRERLTIDLGEGGEGRDR